jgi:hypothetical protein
MPLLIGGVQGVVEPGRAGVVDQNVDAPQCRNSRVDYSVDFLRLGNISLNWVLGRSV